MCIWTRQLTYYFKCETNDEAITSTAEKKEKKTIHWECVVYITFTLHNSVYLYFLRIGSSSTTQITGPTATQRTGNCLSNPWVEHSSVRISTHSEITERCWIISTILYTLYCLHRPWQLITTGNTSCHQAL